MKPFKKLMVANRGEIAIRVLRAANELGIRTVAVYAEEDKLSLHRFKADEAYRVGEGLGPVKAYLTVEEMIRVARDAGVDAIHPGYGFLSENPDFADACIEHDITWIGPPPEIMRSLGNKVSAREMAVAAGTPVTPATGPLPDDADAVRAMAEEVGFPVMLKASWGGGGRGMRIISSEAELDQEVLAGKREAEAAFGNGEVYLEKLVEKARHVEVQLLGDSHGNIIHLFERDCSIQRRNQKVVERAPAPYLTPEQRTEVCEAALKLARRAGYVNAGTAEFLMDSVTGKFYFIEVNPRIQVEHTVTEEITGIDIVKAQIRIAQGAKIGAEGSGVPAQEFLEMRGHAIQCRVTTEDPEENFIPDYGRITAYRGATGFGIRLDGGTAYSGAIITRYYDSLLEKVTAWAPTPGRRIDCPHGPCIAGVSYQGRCHQSGVPGKSDRPSETFSAADYTTRFIDEHARAVRFSAKRRDRASRLLLNFIADVSRSTAIRKSRTGRPRPPANTRFSRNCRPPEYHVPCRCTGGHQNAMLDRARAGRPLCGLDAGRKTPSGDRHHHARCAISHCSPPACGHL